MITNNSINVPQTAFHAYLSATATGVTGDGSTLYTFLGNATLFNQGANYATGTGNFTAPVTGNYQFTCALNLNCSLGIVITPIMTLVTTARSYDICTGNVNQPMTTLTVFGSIMVPMTTGDTAHITVVCQDTGGGNSTDVLGGAGSSYFEGQFIL